MDNEETPEKPASRINIPALIVLVSLVILIPLILVFRWISEDKYLKVAALAQAKKLTDEGRLELALVNLDHLLVQWPDTIEALELQARLLTETARTPDQALEAANVQDHLLRLDPMGPGRQANRARLVELYLSFADAVRYSSTRRESKADKYEARYRVAAKIAQQRISFGADDAEAHRLLAKALEGLSLSGDAKALGDATHEYEIALRRDPTDAISSEHLALINLERRNDRASADQILEALYVADPRSVIARLVRHNYFLKTQREDRAKIELEEAIKLDPTDIRVRLAGAGDAVQRHDIALARSHIDAIPKPFQQDKRVLVLKGIIDIVERNPEEAIGEWRKGLAIAGGNDRDLTYRLAHSLILLGRFEEARLFLDQYARLSTHDTEPMLHFLNGLLKERTGRPTAAIVELEAARPSIDEGTLVEVELVLGRCYEEINDQNKALICYRRAVEATPLSANAHRALARQLLKKSRESAAEELEAALRLLPSNADLMGDLAANYLSHQATLPADQRDFEKVNSLIDRAEKSGLDDLTILKLRAESLTISGRLDQALALIEAASKGPLRNREDVWLLWATGLVQSGRSSKARNVLERASAPDLAGDHVSLRVARAKLLVQAGQARDARKVLSDNPDRLPIGERATLTGARADLLQSLGDLKGASEACIEWSKLAKNDPQPGLKLLSIAQSQGDDGDQTSKVGLELLKSIGGDEEPYSLAARALDLLLSNRMKEETRVTRLEMADRLSQKLQKVAPDLSVTYLIRGMILERNHRIEEAIADYRMALNGNTSSVALSKLIALFTRLKRYRDLALLKREFGASVAIDQLSASAFLEQGDHEGASRMIAQIVEALPDDIQMRAIQAQLLSESGMTQQAEETLRSLISRNKNLPDPWLALLVFQKAKGSKEQLNQTFELAKESYEGEQPEVFLARCQWLLGDQATAIRSFNIAIAKYPTDLAVLKLASAFHESNGRTTDAEKLYRKAITLDDSAVWAKRKLALLLSTYNDRRSWEEAWSLVAPNSSAATDDPEDRLLRATLLERSPLRARRLEAAPALAALVDDLPATNTVAIEARGRLARGFLDSDKAIEALRMIEPVVQGTQSSSPPTMALHIEALARSGKFDEATARLTQLTDLEPKAIRTACCRAWIFQSQGKKSEALNTLASAFAALQDSPESWESGMTCYRLLLTFGDYETAERVVRQLVSRRPREAWLLVRLQNFRGNFAGALQTARGILDKGVEKESLKVLVEMANGSKADEASRLAAEALAESALAQAPNDPDLVLMIGSIRHRYRKFEEEAQLYLKALQTNPSNDGLLNNRAWLLSEFLDKPAEALSMIDQAIKVGGRSSNFCDTRGVVLTRLGRFQDAIVDLQEAVRDQPSATRLFHLARAYQKAGNTKQHEAIRDLVKKAGLEPAMLDPRDRADFDAVMAP